MNKGADIVSKSILGKETRTIIVSGVPYFVKPLTIRKIAGIGYSLSGLDRDGETIKDLLEGLGSSDGAARALSYAVVGDESLYETFLDAPFKDVVDGLEECISLINIRDFQRLSDLSRSVRILIANPK